MLKTYFFELLLNRWTDFHQNRIVSSSDYADQKLEKDFVSIDKTVFTYHSNEFEAWCQNDTWSCISAMLWHIDTKLCVRHCQLTQNTPHRFDNSATSWSKVKSHSIALLVVLNYFSGIWTTIILKCLQLLIAEVGLMLHAMLSSSFCRWCAWPRHCCLQLYFSIDFRTILFHFNPVQYNLVQIAYFSVEFNTVLLNSYNVSPVQYSLDQVSSV